MSKPESRDELAAFEYVLPLELIALRPLPRRDDSRLLIVDRPSGRISDARIADLSDRLDPGDCLVVNDTRVLPARLFGTRVATGGRWEGLFLGLDPRPGSDPRPWRLIGQTRGKLQEGEAVELVPAHPRHPPPSPCLLRLLERGPDGTWLAEPEPPQDATSVLEQFGTVPLPPYVKRSVATDEDRDRYQTVYARHEGAAAAPTAGLHLSQQLLDNCQQRGLGLEAVTLHVGLDTFRPIAVDRLDEHEMHSEWCRLPGATAERLNQIRSRGSRVVAVGTTVVRTLESACPAADPANRSDRRLDAFEGQTELFIRPGHDFAAVDALLTNFHLSRSTLFVLVAAFCGLELAHSAYRRAIEERYRFYSYGDAMLIL